MPKKVVHRLRVTLRIPADLLAEVDAVLTGARAVPRERGLKVEYLLALGLERHRRALRETDPNFEGVGE
jgi:hypothetical protein